MTLLVGIYASIRVQCRVSDDSGGVIVDMNQRGRSTCQAMHRHHREWPEKGIDTI